MKRIGKRARLDEFQPINVHRFAQGWNDRRSEPEACCLAQTIFHARYGTNLPGQRYFSDGTGGAGNRLRCGRACQRSNNGQIRTGLLGLTSGNGGNIQIVGKQIEFAVPVQHGDQHGNAAGIHAIDGTPWRRQH